MGVRQPRVTHQPDAEPGYEWLYEMPLGTRGDVAICGTTTTEAEAEAELARLRRKHGVTDPKDSERYLIAASEHMRSDDEVMARSRNPKVNAGGTP